MVALMDVSICEYSIEKECEGKGFFVGEEHVEEKGEMLTDKGREARGGASSTSRRCCRWKERIPLFQSQ